jgi:hypothetical protein
LLPQQLWRRQLSDSSVYSCRLRNRFPNGQLSIQKTNRKLANRFVQENTFTLYKTVL